MGHNMKDMGWAMQVGNSQTPPEDLTWLIWTDNIY
jgi:hypothetical protein